MANILAPTNIVGASRAPAVGATADTTGGTGIAGATGGSSTLPNVLGDQDFLKLLMLQLRNQDPLNPLDDQQFIGQMAQLSTLQATNDLGKYMQQVVVADHQSQALQMVGHDVVYLDEGGGAVQGHVSAVRLDTMPPNVVVGDREVSVFRVQKVL